VSEHLQLCRVRLNIAETMNLYWLPDPEGAAVLLVTPDYEQSHKLCCICMISMHLYDYSWLLAVLVRQEHYISESSPIGHYTRNVEIFVWKWHKIQPLINRETCFCNPTAGKAVQYVREALTSWFEHLAAYRESKLTENIAKETIFHYERMVLRNVWNFGLARSECLIIP
jgi:hypothetical protein